MNVLQTRRKLRDCVTHLIMYTFEVRVENRFPDLILYSEGIYVFIYLFSRPKLEQDFCSLS